MTAKVPLTVFNNPFISGITATTTTTNSSSDFSFSLSTNFPSGPSCKLSYSPTASIPFSLSLKSGLGIFGSPRHSPLVFSANFSLPLSPTATQTLIPLPCFFLHFKPQFGHFSLNKTVFSDPKTLPLSPPSLDNNTQFGKGFGAHGSPSGSGWQEMKLEPYGGSGDRNHHDVVPERSLVEKNNEKHGFSPGVAVMTRTVMPVTQGMFLNFRWGVNFPSDLGSKLPYLTVNKIALERVEEVKQKNKGSSEASGSDLQMLKGMCFLMRRDLENVEKENREMKRVLDEMKMGISTKSNGKKLSQHSSESSSGSGEFQRWGSSKNGRQENEQKQPNKSQSAATDLESELQKAIKAASS